MPNITISMDDELLEAGREYARIHRTSLNSLIRNLLAREVSPDKTGWVDAWFALMDQARGNSGRKTWKRADLHER